LAGYALALNPTKSWASLQEQEAVTPVAAPLILRPWPVEPADVPGFDYPKSPRNALRP